MNTLINKGLKGCLEVLMVTHNRLEYLKKALPSLLVQGCDITIWDNGSDKSTLDWLIAKKLQYPDVDMHFSKTNESLAKVTSGIFLSSTAEFVGKVDSDMIIPLDWAERLVEAHRKFHFGFIGGIHFKPEDIVRPKIKSFNGIKIWRKHHIGGQFVIRREDFKGYKGQGVMGLSEYQAEMGLINGYLWPPLWVDHMEDARSEHYINTEEYNDYKLKTRGMSLSQYQGSIINEAYMKENTYE